MNDVDTKLMRAAVVLAEELNFSRAASKLNIGQSALTKQISSLEAYLGHELFERGSRGISVTLPGEAFVEHARLALEQQVLAVQSSRAANAGHEVVLKLGKTPYTDPYLVSNVHAMRLPLHPSLEVRTTTGFAYDLSRELLEGTLDLAFLPVLPETPRLSSVRVSEQPFYVAMLDNDELAASRAIEEEQLLSRNLILFERRVHPHLYDRMTSAWRPLPRNGPSVHHFMTAEEASLLVQRRLGLAILTQAGAWRIGHGNITIRPLRSKTIRLETRLACRADTRNRIVSDFFRAFLRRVADPRPTDQMILSLAR